MIIFSFGVCKIFNAFFFGLFWGGVWGDLYKVALVNIMLRTFCLIELTSNFCSLLIFWQLIQWKNYWVPYVISHIPVA